MLHQFSILTVQPQGLHSKQQLGKNHYRPFLWCRSQRIPHAQNYFGCLNQCMGASCLSLSDMGVWPLRDLLNDPKTWKSQGDESSSMQDVWTPPTAWYSVGRPLFWPHDTGHCAAGCYCHWVYPDIGFWSYIDFELKVLSLSCVTTVHSILQKCLCVWSFILDYKYVQSGQTTRCYMNGRNT